MMTPERINDRRKEIFKNAALSIVPLSILSVGIALLPCGLLAILGVILILAGLLVGLLLVVGDGLQTSKDDRKLTWKEIIFGA